MARLCLQLACAVAAYAFLQPTTQKATARRAIQVQAVADLLPDDVVNSLSAEQLAALYNAPDAVAGAAGGVSEFITTKVGPALGAEAAALGELAGKASEAFATKVVPALKEGGDALKPAVARWRQCYRRRLQGGGARAYAKPTAYVPLEADVVREHQPAPARPHACVPGRA